MRLVTVILTVLLVLIQYPLWLGEGGWLRNRQLKKELVAQQQKNADLELRNDRLRGEVQDLAQGTDAIEERARYELGMVKSDELFIQLVAPDPNQYASASHAGGKSAQDITVSSTRGKVSARPVKVVPDPPQRLRHRIHERR
jgi:cell division protein FtsB